MLFNSVKIPKVSLLIVGGLSAVADANLPQSFNSKCQKARDGHELRKLLAHQRVISASPLCLFNLLCLMRVVTSVRSARCEGADEQSTKGTRVVKVVMNWNVIWTERHSRCN